MLDKESLNKELKSNLEEDELLIWSDYPKQSFQLVFEDLIIIPFLSIPFFIMTFGFVKILNLNTNKDIILTTILFLFIFCFLINNRYIQKLNIQKKSIYALTTKRAIIIADSKIKSLNLTDIKEISFVEHPFNFKYGSVIFGEPENVFGSLNEPFKFSYLLGHHEGMNLKRDDFAFDFINNTKTTYNLIKSKIS